MRAARHLADDNAGNAFIEFALGSGVLIAVFTGTFQFGYTFLKYNDLQNAVIRGARYAALATYDSSTSSPSAAFTTAVKNMVLYGKPTGGISPAVDGLTADHVILTVSFAKGVPSTVTVRISGYTVNSVFSPTTLVNKPKATYVYQGIWAPA
jgi:Flp pilus assembly protein TadG